MQEHFVVINVTAAVPNDFGFGLLGGARPSVIQKSYINAKHWVDSQIRLHPEQKFVIFKAYSEHSAAPIEIQTALL